AGRAAAAAPKESPARPRSPRRAPAAPDADGSTRRLPPRSMSASKASRRQLPDHVLQDAAILEIFELVKRIDAADQRRSFAASVGEPDLGFKLLARPQIAGEAVD